MQVNLSPRAIRHFRLRQLADSALGDYSGGLVCCGPASLADSALLMNLAKSWGTPIGFLEPFNDAARKDLARFKSSGYMYTSPSAESMLAALRDRPSPLMISFLLVKDGPSDPIMTTVQQLIPLMAPGAMIVSDAKSRLRDTLSRLAAKKGWGPWQDSRTEGGLTIWKQLPHKPILENPDSPAEISDATTILCYPNPPGGKFARMCRMAGYRISRDPHQRFDFAIKWWGETYTPNDAVLEELAAATRVINAGCTNISKKYVEEVNHKIFGYGLCVDPMTYHGRAVVKSNLNARGGERVAECPAEFDERPYVVYQRRVTTPREPEEFEEYRVAITGGTIPAVVIKRRPLESHFNRSAGYGIITTADEVLSQKEQDKSLALCAEMGLEFGDLDILRDKEDGKIHVIDVNPTPGGPGGGYTPEQITELVSIQLEALRRVYGTP